MASNRETLLTHFACLWFAANGRISVNTLPVILCNPNQWRLVPIANGRAEGKRQWYVKPEQTEPKTGNCSSVPILLPPKSHKGNTDTKEEEVDNQSYLLGWL